MAADRTNFTSIYPLSSQSPDSIGSPNRLVTNRARELLIDRKPATLIAVKATSSKLFKLK